MTYNEARFIVINGVQVSRARAEREGLLSENETRLAGQETVAEATAGDSTNPALGNENQGKKVVVSAPNKARTPASSKSTARTTPATPAEAKAAKEAAEAKAATEAKSAEGAGAADASAAATDDGSKGSDAGSGDDVPDAGDDSADKE